MAGLVPVDFGTLIPSSGSSVRGVLRDEDVAHVGRSRVPRRERRKTPTCLNGLQDGGVVQRNGPRGSEDVTGRNEGRYEHGGHANPEPGEVETELARTGVRRHGPGRGATWS